jgi:beta-glucanase (GH16 family)
VAVVVAVICACAMLDAGQAVAGGVSATVAGTSPASVSSVGLSACGHKIRHKSRLTHKQIRHRRYRWARLCRLARAQVAAQIAAQQAAAQQSAADQAAAQAAADQAAADQAAADEAAAEQAALAEQAAQEAAAQEAAAAQAAAERAAAEQAAAEQAAYEATLSPTSAPAQRCGSTTYVKADGTTYTCSFSDEFSGSTLDATKWTPVTTAVTGQRTGVECVVNDPDTLSVGDEALTITARRLTAPTTCTSPYGSFDTSYTGGMITTYKKFAQTNGRFEMRARFPQASVAGVQSSLWMFPQTFSYGAWPKSGEIDIAEWFSGWGDLVVPHLHYDGDSTDLFRTSYSCTLGDPAAFHTYAVEWTSTSITFLYDGQTCLRNTAWSPLGSLLVAPAPFDKPFNLLIGNGRGTGKNAPSESTPFPSALQVDYVRAWS